MLLRGVPLRARPLMVLSRLPPIRTLTTIPPSPTDPKEPLKDADPSKSPFERLKEMDLRNKMQDAIHDTKERLFAKDETSWRDALRAVFGLKPVDAGHDTPVDEAEKVKNAMDKAKEATEKTGKTAEGGVAPDATQTLTPEQEAHQFLQQQHEQKESFYEKKLAELGKKIQESEVQREAAQDSGDMPKFKEMNKKVREVRKEMEQIQAKMNTTSVILVEEQKGTWEKFGEQLRETPLLKGIFGFSQTTAGKKITGAAEDAREVWETSQHPLVYRVQSAWDNLFAETEMGEAIREFRKIDPNFNMERFVTEMEETLIPQVLGAFLREDVDVLNKFLSEGAFQVVKSAIDERRRSGRKMDPNILNIQHAQVAAAKVVEKMESPMIVLQFMAQQIDCLYDATGKTVVEGRDDKVAAVFYAFAMTLDRSEKDASLKWVIKEFAIVGQVPFV